MIMEIRINCNCNNFTLFVVTLSLILSSCAGIRKTKYTTQNAHSHNDYEQTHYYTQATNAAFGSMEADIYLVNGELLVAHNKAEQSTDRNLKSMYLNPVKGQLLKHGGFPYTDHGRQLQLLIDLKDANSSDEFDSAVALLTQYPAIMESGKIKVTFTGNIPEDSVMVAAPSFIHFDGVPGHTYSKAAEKRIYMYSDNFRNYSAWDGTSQLAPTDFEKLTAVVKMAHSKGKKVRFWNAPDNPKAWKVMMKLNVDYINTDHIDDLAAFLKGQP